MSDEAMGASTRSGTGARRASEAVLYAGGGRTVTVLMPRPAQAGSVAEQLGLAMPEMDGLELAPVLLREKKGAGAESEAEWELLVPASRLEALSGAGAAAARAFLGVAAGVLVDGAVLQVLEVSSRECAGVPYLYRVRLQMAAAGSL